MYYFRIHEGLDRGEGDLIGLVNLQIHFLKLFMI